MESMRGGGNSCGHGHLGLRWSSLWGHELREGCAKMGRGRHATAATGAVGGAPDWATKHLREVPAWGGAAMQPLPLGLWGHE